MYIRTPRIGAVCSADPNDIQALAGDFAYELRQFFKTERDGERRSEREQADRHDVPPHAGPSGASVPALLGLPVALLLSHGSSAISRV